MVVVLHVGNPGTIRSIRGGERTGDGLLRRWGPDVLVAILAGASTTIGIRSSLWADELWSVGMARLPLAQLWSRYLWGSESNMTLYYLVLHGWLVVADRLGFPADELIIRLPSAAFSVAATVAVFEFGRHLGGVLAGVVAASLFTLNFLVLDSAGNSARSYSLTLLLITVSWLVFLRIVDRPQLGRLWYLCYALVTGLAVYAHYLSLLAFMAQGLSVLVILVITKYRREPIWEGLIPWLCASGLAIILAIPILVDGAVHGPTNTSVVPARPVDFVHFVGALTDRQFIFAVVLAAAVVTGMATVYRRKGAAGLISWLVLPVLISYALTQQHFNLHLFSVRYLVLLTPPICLLAGLGVALLGGKRGALAGSLMLGLALAPVADYSIHPQREDIRGATTWVADRYVVGDGVICLTWGCAMGMDYYQPTLMPPGSPGKIVWGDGWRGGAAAHVDETSIAGYATDHRRVFLVTDLDVSADPTVQWSRNWFDQRYDLVSQMSASGTHGPVTVREYEAIHQSG